MQWRRIDENRRRSSQHSLESPEINMKIIERVFAGASEAGVELIVFPETTFERFTNNAERAYVKDAWVSSESR